MDLSYKTVVNYVKNLFPGAAPVATSDNPQLDAQFVAFKSRTKFYTVASNRHRYWYCFVDDVDIPLVKYILHSNGVNVSKHNSRYFLCTEPVLRVRTSNLEKTPSARAFVESVMNMSKAPLDVTLIQSRISQIQQRMK